MHQDWNIEHCEEEYVYTHIWVAHLRFRISALPHCYWMEHLAFRVNVASVLVPAAKVVLVEVHVCRCISSVSGDSVQCHFCKEGSHLSDFPKAMWGAYPALPSHCIALQTQLPTSSLLGFPPKVSWFAVDYPLLRCATTPLWPFWPYSRPGACQTVLAVPDLLALPQLQTCWHPTRNLLLHQQIGFGYYIQHIRFCSILVRG